MVKAHLVTEQFCKGSGTKSVTLGHIYKGKNRRKTITYNFFFFVFSHSLLRNQDNILKESGVHQKLSMGKVKFQ